MYFTRFVLSHGPCPPQSFTCPSEMQAYRIFQGNADDGCIEMALAFGFEEEMKKSFEDLKTKISNNNSDDQTKSQTVSED